MKLDRRHFIAAGIGAASAACRHSFNLDPTMVWLSLELYGLAALVIDESTGELKVFMVSHTEVSNGKSFPHKPRLIAPASAIARDNKTMPTKRYIDSATGREMAYWDANGCQVSLSTDRVGESDLDKKLKLIKTLIERKAGVGIPDVGTYGDLSFIPHMAKLTPSGRARINRECLAPDPTSAKIIARAYFAGGQLSALFKNPPTPTSPHYDTIPFSFEPTPPLGAYQQALATPRLIQQIPSGTVTFTLQPFDRSSSRDISLFASKVTGGPLEVRLTNESRAPDDNNQCSSDAELQTLDHFTAYYDVLDASDRGEKMPIPVVNRDDRDKLHCGAGDIIIWCPSMIFSPLK